MSVATVRYCPQCLTTFGDDLARCPNLGCGNRAPPEGWGTLLEDGAVFDRHYRVLWHLAVGGAGITYRARELDASGEETGPDLAIKVLYAGRDQGGWLKRLATEASILQELDHPNIVECRGFVHRTGHPPYLVTRFEEGGTLLDHLRRVGPLAPRVAAGIGRQIGWALHLAHARGIIHRDLKPENVLLTAEVGGGEIPTVRVADFGIAKVVGGLGARTREGAFVGTPAYAAPEQMLGAPPTPATDIYGLGALLFFCATGGVLIDVEALASWEERRDALVARLPPRLPGPDSAVGRFNALLAATLAAEAADRAPLEDLDALFIEVLAREEPEAAPEPAGETLAYTISGELERSAVPRPTWGDEVRPARPAHDLWVPPVLSPPPQRPEPAPALAPPPASPAGRAARPAPSKQPIALVLVLGALGLIAISLLVALGLAWAYEHRASGLPPRTLERSPPWSSP